jgi:hypothetical protein
MDAQTLESWIKKLGYDAIPEGPSTFRIKSKKPDAEELPPFIVQQGEHWILLSMLPVLSGEGAEPEDLPSRLLTVNREMRLVKFALGENDEVILCAELPTESLDYSELSDAIERIIRYYLHYRDYLHAL